jgi:hypothetical protein
MIWFFIAVLIVIFLDCYLTVRKKKKQEKEVEIKCKELLIQLNILKEKLLGKEENDDDSELV